MGDEITELWEKTFSLDELNSKEIDKTYKVEYSTALDSDQSLMDDFSQLAQEMSKIQKNSSKENLKKASLIEKYENFEEISRGGMGIIYEAKQKKLKRQIAVKRKTQSASSQKFISEAWTTSYLEHPNIIPVYDIDSDEDGELLLAMKLVKGITWKDVLYFDYKNIPAKDFLDKHLRILLDVCNAIAFAHSKNIIHNDLKPSNIMIGEFAEVLVMDWGIAVDVSDNQEKRALANNDIHHAMGTPSYMAPELAEGKGNDISPATDIYLLGGILYEILMKKPPHAKDSVMMCLVSALKAEKPVFSASMNLST